MYHEFENDVFEALQLIVSEIACKIGKNTYLLSVVPFALTYLFPRTGIVGKNALTQMQRIALDVYNIIISDSL